MIRSRMELPMTRAEELRAGCGPDDTRPDGCECMYDDGYITTAASEHDDTNEMCPLFECDCGHAKRDHGPQGCDVELGDRYFPSKGISEAGGPCLCELTSEDLVLIGRYGSLEVGRRIVEAQERARLGKALEAA